MADDGMEGLERSLEAAVDKYVKQQARNTLALNAERDRACAGYARIPGPDACDFCVTMGAHSDFYHTRETAGGGDAHGTADDRYHPYCNCAIALVFERDGRLVARDPDTGDAIDYDGADLVRRYREAGSPTYSGKGSTKARKKAREELKGRCVRCSRPIFDDGPYRAAAKAAYGPLHHKGWYEVYLHGSPKTVELFGARADAKLLADIIRARGDYHGGPIRLMSCRTGKRDASGDCFAQRLANELGVRVEAPDDIIWVNPGGWYTIGPEEGIDTGTIIIFDPRKK